MEFQDVITMLKSLNIGLHPTEFDGVLWTIEEHCYTIYPSECKVYDSEGDMPEIISDNLEALRWYFKYKLIISRIENVMYE